MRLRFALALFALTALAACDQAATPKGAGSARAPIGAAATPSAAKAGPATAAANCPPAPPACPPLRTASAGKTHSARRASTVRHAVHRAKPPAKAAADRRYAKAETDLGLPPRPYRYDELRPSPARPDHHDRWAEKRGFHHHHHMQREDRSAAQDGDERFGSEDRRVEPAPPPRHERYAEHWRERGYDEGEAYENRRYEYRSESEERGAHAYVEGPCCAAPRAQAAGFDERGFLTWPGKVPPR